MNGAPIALATKEVEPAVSSRRRDVIIVTLLIGIPQDSQVSSSLRIQRMDLLIFKIPVNAPAIGRALDNNKVRGAAAQLVALLRSMRGLLQAHGIIVTDYAASLKSPICASNARLKAGRAVQRSM